MRAYGLDVALGATVVFEKTNDVIFRPQDFQDAISHSHFNVAWKCHKIF